MYCFFHHRCLIFFWASLLFYLCTPPSISVFLAHTHTDIVLNLCLPISLFLPLLLPPSLTYSTSFYLARSFFSFVSLSLSIYIGLLHCTFPSPFSFYSTTSPFGSPYLSHSGVQLSFIRFFRKKVFSHSYIYHSYSVFICDCFPLSFLVHPSSLFLCLVSHSRYFHLLGICFCLRILSGLNLN